MLITSNSRVLSPPGCGGSESPDEGRGLDDRPDSLHGGFESSENKEHAYCAAKI